FSNREVYAAAYAHAGRIDQARRHASSFVEELRATWVGKPATDVSDLLRWEFKYNYLYKRFEIVALVIDGLHKAGLPIAVQDIGLRASVPTQEWSQPEMGSGQT